MQYKVSYDLGIIQRNRGYSLGMIRLFIYKLYIDDIESDELFRFPIRISDTCNDMFKI